MLKAKEETGSLALTSRQVRAKAWRGHTCVPSRARLYISGHISLRRREHVGEKKLRIEAVATDDVAAVDVAAAAAAPIHGPP